MTVDKAALRAVHDMPSEVLTAILKRYCPLDIERWEKPTGVRDSTANTRLYLRLYRKAADCDALNKDILDAHRRLKDPSVCTTQNVSGLADLEAYRCNTTQSCLADIDFLDEDDHSQDDDYVPDEETEKEEEDSAYEDDESPTPTGSPRDDTGILEDDHRDRLVIVED